MNAVSQPPVVSTARAAPQKARVPRAKQLKRRLRSNAVRALLAVLSLIPLGLARKLGELLGELGFRLAGRERTRALESLRRAFPDASDEQRTALARASFRHLGRAAMEVACIRQLDVRLTEEVRFPPSAKAVLETALARGKGVVFVSGHVGHWELLARRVAKEGFPCQSIARETTDARLTEWVAQFRARGGVRSIWRGGEGAARQMLRSLKAGEILGLLIDQDTDVQSVWVPFFGELAKTPRAAADLALRTGAAVVVGFCPREADGRYTLKMEELPVPSTSKGDRDAEATELTALFTQRIEAAIRATPEQWVWMHRRWKSPRPA